MHTCKTSRELLGVFLPLVMLTGLGGVACGEERERPSAEGGKDAGGSGGSKAGSMNEGGGAGSSQQGGSAGNGGAATIGGIGGGAGAETGPPVPRVENTEGDSVLDNPKEAALGAGKCEGAAVYCGECLATEGQTAGKCTALKLGLGQTTSLALTTEALFYTAANQEILKLDFAQDAHSSLVRGLTFVQALVVDGDALYFSTEAPDTFFKYDVRSVALGGGDVTVLSPPQNQEIGAIVPLPEQLLFGVGSFEWELFTIPKSGGPATSFGGIRGATWPVLDGSTLYYRTSDGLSSTSIETPAPDNTLNSEFSNARFVLEGDYLYYFISDSYTRTPISGGTPEVIQALPDAGIRGRTTDQIIFTQLDSADEQLMRVFSMPIEGGTPIELTILESTELKAVAANDTDVYLAVGSSHAGAILRVALE